MLVTGETVVTMLSLLLSPVVAGALSGCVPVAPVGAQATSSSATQNSATRRVGFDPCIWVNLLTGHWGRIGEMILNKNKDNEYLFYSLPYDSG